MPYIHCSLGPGSCKQCQDLESKGESFSLLRFYLEPFDYARPSTSIIKDGKKIDGAYDVLQRFEDIIEAKIYAKDNNIPIEFY